MSEFLETMKSADSGHAWRVLDEFMDAVNYSAIELPSIKRRGLTLDSPRA